MSRKRVVGHLRITAMRLAAILAGLCILGGCGRSQETQELAFQPLVAQEEFVIDGYDAVFVPVSSVRGVIKIFIKVFVFDRIRNRRWCRGNTMVGGFFVDQWK